MRLINTKTLKFQEFFDESIPDYAILSHRWQAGEVSYKEYRRCLRDHQQSDSCPAGFTKILSFCKMALEANLDWGWVDTCCIDKRSSAELSEAINSMFNWYNGAKVCIAYLHDVSGIDRLQTAAEAAKLVLGDMERSEWFARGWTLQELLAPSRVCFVTQAWEQVGWKDDWMSWGEESWFAGTTHDIVTPSLFRIISEETVRQAYIKLRWFEDSDVMMRSALPLAKLLERVSGIPLRVLQKPDAVRDVCIAEKMRWAAARHTSRGEDMAYSMLGLFDVNMPLLYGEGAEKAFIRLQLEIIKKTTDESIFAWSLTELMQLNAEAHHGTWEPWKGLLAPHPKAFQKVRTVSFDSSSGPVSPCGEPGSLQGLFFTITHRGMQLNCRASGLAKLPNEAIYAVPLNCQVPDGRCVLILGELSQPMAKKWDGDFNYLMRILSEVNPDIAKYGKLQPKQFYIEQSGFNDSTSGLLLTAG